jgi:hypothetical protein
LSYGVVDLGDHLITGGVREYGEESAYDKTVSEVAGTFEKGDFTELVRVVDKEFGSGSYSLKLLFRDEQRKIVRLILEGALTEAEAAYRQLYENRAPLMHYIAGLNLPAVRILQVAAEFTLNADIRRTIEAEQPNVQRVQTLLDEVKRMRVPLDATTLEFAFRKKLENMAERFRANPVDLPLLESLEAAVAVARAAPLNVQMWRVQNLYFNMMTGVYQDVRAGKVHPDGDGDKWQEHFRSLGEKLSFRMG